MNDKIFTSREMLKVKYRPKGWEKTVDKITSGILDIEGHDGDPNLVEAGADAMLEGLKREGKFVNFYETDTRQYSRGWTVFIPEVK